MNHAKIGAALHALAEAFLEGVETVESAVTGGKKGKSKTTTEQPAAPAAAPAAAAPAVAAAPAAAPAVPTIDKAKLNAAVLKVAAKSRDDAEAILAKYGAGAKNTVTLDPQYWQPVFDALEEQIAKYDAAAVQVQQASLV